jgi:hypothetical protein
MGRRVIRVMSREERQALSRKYFYHISRLENRDSILREGLKPGIGGGFSKEGFQRGTPAIFLFPSLLPIDEVIEWNELDPVAIFKVKIPNSSKLFIDSESVEFEEDEHYGPSLMYFGDIPSSYIRYLGTSDEVLGA